MRPRHVILGLLFLALLVGCRLDRSGGAGTSAGLAVAPEWICPGQGVTVSWNAFAALPRSPANCRSCATDAGCSVGEQCIDAQCCRVEAGIPCRVDGACLPRSIDLTIAGLGTTLRSGGGASLADSVVVAPASTTTYTARGGFREPVGGFVGDKVAHVVQETDRHTPVIFPFACGGSTFGWLAHDFDRDGPTTSGQVEVDTVRNLGRLRIFLTGGSPVRTLPIEPGAATTEFAGRLNGTWVAFIDPAARLGLPVPRCTGTDVADPLPDIEIEIGFRCALNP